MKRITKAIIAILTLVFLSIIVDQRLFRCYFFQKITANPKLGNIINEDTSIEYNVKNMGDGLFTYSIYNKSLIPKYILVYRDNEMFFDLNSENIFSAGSRRYINAPKMEIMDNAGFICGTVLGAISINSFEIFSMKESYQNLLSRFSMDELLLKLDTGYCDIFRGSPLIKLLKNNEFEFVNNVDILSQDSIEIQFYLPTYSVFNGAQTNNYSNTLKISYIDLLSQYVYK